MGRDSWRLQERVYLEELASSVDGKELLARAEAALAEESSGTAKDKKWWKDATNWFAQRYRERFEVCFSAETPEEFATRRKLHPRSKLEPFPAETEADRDARMDDHYKVCIRCPVGRYTPF